MKTTINIDFSLERVSDLLCSAFEGGSNYWYMIEKFIKPPVVKGYTGLPDVYRHLDYPLSPGGALIVSDAVGSGCDGTSAKRARLNLKSIRRGLSVMAEKYPQHFAAWREENDDAETGDVFLQCCLFNEVVYG
jgi:hypothetical protein